MNKEYDWSKFVVRINIAAPQSKLYAAWATRSVVDSKSDGRLCKLENIGGI